MVLEDDLELLTQGVRRSFDDEQDVDDALTADQQGLGSGPDAPRAASGLHVGPTRAGTERGTMP